MLGKNIMAEGGGAVLQLMAVGKQRQERALVQLDNFQSHIPRNLLSPCRPHLSNIPPFLKTPPPAMDEEFNTCA
jgi:hypothetical protein